MDLASVLLGGLGGACIALVGAFGLQAWQNLREGRAACRACFMEVSYNSACLKLMADKAIFVPLTVNTWQESQLKLANLLSPADFVVVATLYMRLLSVIHARAGSAPGTPLSPPERQAAQESFERSEAPAKILQEKGWRPDECAQLEAQLRKLDPGPR
jgi:hypothetical protein